MKRQARQKRARFTRLAGAFLIAFGTCAALYAGIGMGQCIYQSVRKAPDTSTVFVYQVETSSETLLPIQTGGEIHMGEEIRIIITSIQKRVSEDALAVRPVMLKG